MSRGRIKIFASMNMIDHIARLEEEAQDSNSYPIVCDLSQLRLCAGDERSIHWG